MHVKPRLTKFTPSAKTTAPGSGKDEDPYYDLLGQHRTAFVKFKNDPSRTIELVDDMAQVGVRDDQLAQEWTGETHFPYRKPDPTTHRGDVTMTTQDETTDPALRRRQLLTTSARTTSTTSTTWSGAGTREQSGLLVKGWDYMDKAPCH